MRLVTVQNTTRNARIGSQIELASTQRTRLVGLLGRPALQQEEGLWIRPSSGVHTFGMSFPIDVIGLDKDNRIIKLWDTLRPQRLTKLYWKLQSVIELPEGTIQRTGAQIGDALQININTGV
jgi:uncharacterized protein